MLAMSVESHTKSSSAEENIEALYSDHTHEYNIEMSSSGPPEERKPQILLGAGGVAEVVGIQAVLSERGKYLLWIG